MLNVGWMTAAAGIWRQGDEEPGHDPDVLRPGPVAA